MFILIYSSENLDCGLCNTKQNVFAKKALQRKNVFACLQKNVNHTVSDADKILVFNYVALSCSKKHVTYIVENAYIPGYIIDLCLNIRNKLCRNLQKNVVWEVSIAYCQPTSFKGC